MAEKDTRLWVIPTEVYKDAMAASAPLANFTNELMATRFTDVMWLIEQIMWKSLDKRLAAFLLEEAAIDGGDVLKITHEPIANHLGSHREVITRMLRYFQARAGGAFARHGDDPRSGAAEGVGGSGRVSGKLFFRVFGLADELRHRAHRAVDAPTARFEQRHRHKAKHRRGQHHAVKAEGELRDAFVENRSMIGPMPRL